MTVNTFLLQEKKLVLFMMEYFMSKQCVKFVLVLKLLGVTVVTLCLSSITESQNYWVLACHH